MSQKKKKKGIATGNFLKQSSTLGNLTFGSFWPKTKCNASKTELGHLSKLTGITWQRYLTKCTGPRSRKNRLSQISKFFIQEDRIWNVTQKWYKNQAVKMYSYWSIALLRPWKSGSYVIKIDNVNIIFSISTIY